jgi:hypothetical protein
MPRTSMVQKVSNPVGATSRLVSRGRSGSPAVMRRRVPHPATQAAVHVIQAVPDAQKARSVVELPKRVPNHLRAFFNGRREIVVSLHTRDEGEAGARVLAIALETEKELQRARERFRTLVIDPERWQRNGRRRARRPPARPSRTRPADSTGTGARPPWSRPLSACLRHRAPVW